MRIEIEITPEPKNEAATCWLLEAVAQAVLLRTGKGEFEMWAPDTLPASTYTVKWGIMA